jgi:hypothetical protein
MKKIVFITLLCFSVAAIAVTSGNSQTSGIASAGITNIADTTPKTHHHTMVKKPAHDNTVHKATTKTKTKSKATKPKKSTKSTKDSTSKK